VTTECGEETRFVRYVHSAAVLRLSLLPTADDLLWLRPGSRNSARTLSFRK